MIKKLFKTLFCLVILLTFSNCGFKVVDQNYFKNYQINEVVTNGDKRISYLLKNKLRSSKESSASLKNIKLVIKINKQRSIKEKNLQNQITKYKIIITTSVNYEIEDYKSGNFTINEQGDYSVADRYTLTLNNEKKLLKLMTVNIEEKITNNLRLVLDDI